MGYNLRPSSLVKTSLNKPKKMNRNHPDDSDSESESDIDDKEDIDYSENHVDEDDKDYDEEDYDDEDDEVDEVDEVDEDDDEDYDDYDEEDTEGKMMPIISISNSKNGGITFKIGKRRVRNDDHHGHGQCVEECDGDVEKDTNNMIEMFSDKESEYWKTLTDVEKTLLTNKFKEIK